jgi:hypothetical protein
VRTGSTKQDPERKTQKATSNFQKKFVVFSPLCVLEC